MCWVDVLPFFMIINATDSRTTENQLMTSAWKGSLQCMLLQQSTDVMRITGVACIQTSM
jgi:hypothetical protein